MLEPARQGLMFGPSGQGLLLGPSMTRVNVRA